VGKGADDWLRLYWNVVMSGTPGNSLDVRPGLAFGGSVVPFSVDAFQFEEGHVATGWKPGQSGPAVVMDVGGIAVDAAAGGILRLRGATGGVRDIVQLYDHGLRFGTTEELYSPTAGGIQMPALDLPVAAAPANPAASTGRLYIKTGGVLAWRDSAGTEVVLGVVAQGTAFPGSPATNDRYFRTDLSMEFFWNGTRWLSTTLFERELRNFEAGTGRQQPYTVTQGSAMRGGLPNSALWMERVVIPFFVSSGGTALGASHKWDVDLLLDPSGTSYGSTTINSGASNTWRQANTTVGVVVPATDFETSVTVTKTGTPGDLRIFPQLMYRRIAT
jgi:hypothetical protein